jgi:hypothetical protein
VSIRTARSARERDQLFEGEGRFETAGLSGDELAVWHMYFVQTPVFGIAQRLFYLSMPEAELVVYVQYLAVRIETKA